MSSVMPYSVIALHSIRSRACFHAAPPLDRLNATAMETVEQRVQRLIAEDVSIEPYDPGWPELFQLEKSH
jgi:hypothetical protein